MVARRPKNWLWLLEYDNTLGGRWSGGNSSGKEGVTVDRKVAQDFMCAMVCGKGCVLARTLLNLYMNLVMKQWKDKCVDFKVYVS